MTNTRKKKMANVFMGLFIRLDTTEVCISVLEHISTETFKSEKDEIEKEQHIGEEGDIANGVTFK